MTINLSNVRYYYPNRPDKAVLNIPSWSVSSEELVFVHGPSGVGKSTLLNLISGLLPVRKGCVDVLGQRLDKMPDHQRDQFRANHVGYVFQQFNLIPYLNPVENIQLANHFNKSTKSISLYDDIRSLLTTLDLPSADWQKPVAKLSVGQQQRVAIARALINKPKLLICDEPTSSLDQKNRDIFMSLLMSIVVDNKITLLFVSHDLSLTHYFRRIEALCDINQIEGMK